MKKPAMGFLILATTPPPRLNRQAERWRLRRKLVRKALRNLHLRRRALIAKLKLAPYNEALILQLQQVKEKITPLRDELIVLAKAREQLERDEERRWKKIAATNFSA